MKLRFPGLVVFTAIILTSCNQADPMALTMPPIFSNHMVVQQSKEIAIWGNYTPSSKIEIKGSWGTTASAVSEMDGHWLTNLSTPEAGGPFTIQVITTDSTITLSDVYSGEVWLASGQSNMEMPLTGFLPNEPVDNYEEEIANANFPLIREFHVLRAMSLIPEEDYVGEWKMTSPETAAEMSATAYFFARKLNQDLNIPIGIIHSSWGGTPVESWMSREKMIALNEFKAELEALDVDKVNKIKAYYDQFPTAAVPNSEEGWNNLDLGDGAFSSPEFDDSSWKQTELTTLFEDLEGKGTDGAIWFRKSINVEDISSDYTFRIADGIDDSDITYFNGQRIGNTNCWNCPRSYHIPKSLLKKGMNTIAIRAIDTGGPGGASGAITLTSQNGISIPVTSGWRYLRIAGLESSKFLLYHQRPELLNNPPEGLGDYALNANSPGVLYNAMIHPVIPYTIKGAIWYQGETNVRRAEQYMTLFPGMIADWREQWNNDFPFYFVQIAPFGYGNGLSPALRDVQRKTLSTPNTGMAITMDIGSEPSIHPGNKQDVGNRLARLALANDYGKDIVSTGPLYRSHSINDDIIEITFDHVGSGLMAKKNKLDGFEISGADGNFVPAKAVIENNIIKVSSPSIRNPVKVRYGWKDYLVPSLFNKEGLPASSFESN